MFRAFPTGDRQRSSDSSAGDHHISSNQRSSYSPALSMWQRLGSAMMPMWKKVVSPRVVIPTERSKRWTTGGVISTFDLTRKFRAMSLCGSHPLAPQLVQLVSNSMSRCSSLVVLLHLCRFWRTASAAGACCFSVLTTVVVPRHR